jgi:AAA ATPase-like protein
MLLYCCAMDPRHNPYSPGAGLRPVALTGRDTEIDAFAVVLYRARNARPAPGMILHGLRGVGKTVLLNELSNSARSDGWVVATVEADLRGTRTPFRQQVAAALSEGLRKESGKSNFGERMRKAAATLKSFSVTVLGSGAAVELRDRGSSGSLNADFSDLALDLAEGARDIDTGVAVFIDEMQHLDEDELAAICQSCHAANQQNLPFVIVGAGLPNLPRVLSDAASYAERLFDYRSIGRLGTDDATGALVLPARREQVEWEPGAVEVVLAASGGYPYFIQQFGQTAWDAATASPISPANAATGIALGREKLDNGFFRARWDRATPAERDYMAAMAADGDRPSESGAVAKRLGKAMRSLGPARANLIAKGLVWAPEHGQIAFSVPGMSAFIERELARN